MGASKIQRDLDLNLRDFVQADENACGQEGVPAQRKEVIVNTDLFDLQHLCPDAGQCFLERRPWRDGGPREGSLGRETQFSRQADTLHFAGRAFWDFR